MAQKKDETGSCVFFLQVLSQSTSNFVTFTYERDQFDVNLRQIYAFLDAFLALT